MGEKIVLEQLVYYLCLFSYADDSKEFVQNGTSMQTLSINILQPLFVWMQSYPHIRLRSRFLMRVRSDRFSTRCHILKLLLVRQFVRVRRLEKRN